MSQVHDRAAVELVRVLWAQVGLSRRLDRPGLLPDVIFVHPSVRAVLINSAYVRDHRLMEYGDPSALLGTPLIIDPGCEPGTWRIAAPDHTTLRYGKINVG